MSLAVGGGGGIHGGETPKGRKRVRRTEASERRRNPGRGVIPVKRGKKRKPRGLSSLRDLLFRPCLSHRPDGAKMCDTLFSVTPQTVVVEVLCRLAVAFV